VVSNLELKVDRLLWIVTMVQILMIIIIICNKFIEDYSFLFKMWFKKAQWMCSIHCANEKE